MCSHILSTQSLIAPPGVLSREIDRGGLLDRRLLVDTPAFECDMVCVYMMKIKVWLLWCGVLMHMVIRALITHIEGIDLT